MTINGVLIEKWRGNGKKGDTVSLSFLCQSEDGKIAVLKYFPKETTNYDACMALALQTVCELEVVDKQSGFNTFVDVSSAMPTKLEAVLKFK